MALAESSPKMDLRAKGEVSGEEGVHLRSPNGVANGEKSSSRSSDSLEESSVSSVSPKARELCDQLRTDIVQELEIQLKQTVETAVDRILEQSEAANLLEKSNWFKENMTDKFQKSDSDIWLPEKKFQFRNSVLTDLFKISHIETVYHIFVAVLLIFALNTMLTDVIEKGPLPHLYHVELFEWAFKGLYPTFQCWCGMFFSSAGLVYISFMVWATNRKPGSKTTTFDYLFLFNYLFYQAAFCALPVVFIWRHDLGPATTMIVTLEQIRMFMKSHAFVRANAEKALLSIEAAQTERSRQQKKKLRRTNGAERFPVGVGSPANGEEDEFCMSNGINLPQFSQYLYFLFAPTLVYRSHYPRTPHVRWRFVAANLLQVGLCVIYSYFVFSRFCFSYFDNFGRTAQFQFSLSQLITSAFGCMLPGALVQMISFYSFLHCWLNAFAEMLRFGDRLFYKDWWNSVTFSAYYRTWNVVVHDWLYTYVYRDVYAICDRKYRRVIAQTAVFMLSAIVHEYVLTVVFRFFYPVLFVIFGGVGFAIANIRGRSRLWNVGLWTGLIMGMGILMCLYSMEWYARKNCPPMNGIMDIFVPRSWFCAN